MQLHLYGAVAGTVLGVGFYLSRTSHADIFELVAVAVFAGAAAIAVTSAVHWCRTNSRVQ